MHLTELSQKVEELFELLEIDIAQIRTKTGLHCIHNCVKCCLYPKIEATVLEFIPLALHVYNTGQVDSFLSKIDQGTSICIALKPLPDNQSQAGCSQYKHRGLICRIFGYSHVTNKFNQRLLATCKPIKEQQPDAVKKASDMLLDGMLGPSGSHYYSQLQGIDYNLGTGRYPINTAIKLAIEKVDTFFYYQNQSD
jgi:uncharacterized protein